MPYSPKQKFSYGQVFFYLRQDTMEINPFSPRELDIAKHNMLQKAYKASPSLAEFLKAATAATGLSERTIRKYLYEIKDIK